MKEDIVQALRLVLTSLDGMLIPGVEAERMRATRAVVEDCIKELEATANECESDSTDGRAER